MSDSLSKLFGSPARVKLLRLFLFNPRGAYTLADASTRARVTPAEARREFRLLEGIGLIAKAPRGKGMRFTLQPNFEYVLALQSLLINTPSRADDIVKLLRGVCKRDRRKSRHFGSGRQNQRTHVARAHQKTRVGNRQRTPLCIANQRELFLPHEHERQAGARRTGLSAPCSSRQAQHWHKIKPPKHP
jgi:hypothetical protein